MSHDITQLEFIVGKRKNRYNDLRDIYGNLDHLFAAVLISEHIRRGAMHFSIDGEELITFKEVMDAYIKDGDVVRCDEDATHEMSH